MQSNTLKDGQSLRKHYYQSSERIATYPEKASFTKHTMGRNNFLAYIGREYISNVAEASEEKIYSINCKKFSSEQKSLLIKAYKQGLTVRVIGAEKEDLEILLHLNRRKIKSNSKPAILIREHPDKVFNKKRALIVLTETNKQSTLFEEDEFKDNIQSLKDELWIIVFPSHQYVDQVSELVQAIYDDISRLEESLKIHGEDGKPRKNQVEVWHFPNLELEVSKWSSLESTLSSFVRHGDVAVIGNVELLISGIQSVGFQKKFSDWQMFGLNDMFGIQILVNGASNSRIVLLGVTECFWGEASAHYVKALLKAGARHILYGSKAGSMNEKSDIRTVKSPINFAIYNRDKRFGHGLTRLNSIISDNPSLRHLAQLTGVETAGIAVTVPTVIGETHDQRQQLGNLNPSTMDNEDGYIARHVNDYNLKFNLELEKAGFLPVHFISDYVHKKKERPSKNQDNLALTPKIARDEAFIKIGSFFGVYATIYGLREYVNIPKEISQPGFDFAKIEDLLKQVQATLNAGMVREAIHYLSNNSVIPGSRFQTIGLICQKYGFVDDAINALEQIKKTTYWNSTVKDQAKLRMRIVQVKLFTQAGRFYEAELEIEDIIKTYSPEDLIQNEQYSSLCRRKAIIEAFKNYNVAHEKSKDKNWKEAELWFNKAKKNDLETFARSIDTSQKQIDLETATNDVFYYIAIIARGKEIPSGWQSNLSVARQRFCVAASENLLWKTNTEKSALTALFIEAAIHLVSNGNDFIPGLMRLCVAHLFNIRIGGSERSEGYGELIAFIQDEKLQDLFRLAMRIDVHGRKIFQSKFQGMPFWPNIQGCLRVFDFPIAERENELRKFLKRQDEKHEEI